MNANPLIAVFALLALGGTFRMALRLHYGVRGPAAKDPTALVLRVVSWLFLLCGGLLVAGTMFVAGFVLFIVLMFSVIDLIVARRRHQQNVAWSIVNRSIDHGQPIGEMLQNNQGRFTLWVASAVRGCIESVQAAAPIESAIAENRGAFPPEAQACAALSPGVGPPLPRLAEAARLENQKHRLGPILQGLVYLAMVGLLGLSICSFVMIRIVPEFEYIFSDFGLEFSPITQSLISSSNWFVNYWYLPFAPLLIPAAALWFATTIAIWLATLGVPFYLFTKSTFFFRLIGKLYYPFLIPLTWLQRLFYPWHRYRILNLLAVTIEERMPMTEAVRRLGSRPRSLPAGPIESAQAANRLARYPSWLVQRRMDRAYETIQGGGDWRDALWGARLLSAADVELLRAAETAGNTPWALRSIATRQLDRATFRFEAWRRALFTAIILVMGALVAWFVIALFIPLIDLIEGLT